MKGISPKIMMASVVAIVLIIFSAFLVHRQSVVVATTQNGVLVPSNENMVDNTTYPNSATTTTQNSTSTPNQTDILSKQVFSNFMTLQESGNLNNQTVQSLTDQLSSQIIDNQPTTKIYTYADLKIIPNPTTEDIKNYGNQLFLLRTKYQNAYIRGAISPDSPYIDPSQAGMMRVFSSMGVLYEQITGDLLKMSVPAGLADLHLQLINMYSSSAFGIKQFEQLDTDPISAISGLNLYNQNSGQEDTIIQKIANYFGNNGIIFSSNDPGYGWYSI